MLQTMDYAQLETNLVEFAQRWADSGMLQQRFDGYDNTPFEEIEGLKLRAQLSLLTKEYEFKAVARLGHSSEPKPTLKEAIEYALDEKKKHEAHLAELMGKIYEGL